MEERSAAARAVAAAGELLEPEQVAEAVVEGLAAERFLIVPHRRRRGPRAAGAGHADG